MTPTAIQPLPPSSPAVAPHHQPEQVAAPAPAASTHSPGPNPELRVDPQLGIVVLEFFDAHGKTVSSLPSERVLAEYRRAGQPTGTELSAERGAGLPEAGLQKLA